MTSPSEQAGRPAYTWALRSEPDVLYVQLPGVAAAGAGDAMQTLFQQRGFEPVEADGDGAGVANGCALVRADDEKALLVVSISDRIGATQIPVEHGDAAWSRRVFEAGQVLVVLTRGAVVDGAVSDEGLQRDAEAGGLSAAVVAAGAL